VKRALGALAAAGVAVLAMAGPAQAGILVKEAQGCTSSAPRQVFLPWMDFANYVPAPGGFAESTTGWKLAGGAALVAGNEPWKVSGGGSRALALPVGSRATTSAMCVGIGHPTMRFFARRTSGSLLSTLNVEVLFEGPLGLVLNLPIGAVVGGGAWQLTLPFPVVASLLPLLPGSMTPVAFRFTPVGGAWQLDDVYVDPWKAR
jgi:hypothetical protein